MQSLPKQPSSRVFGAGRLLFIQVVEDRVSSQALHQHWWESWSGTLIDQGEIRGKRNQSMHKENWWWCTDGDALMVMVSYRWWALSVNVWIFSDTVWNSSFSIFDWEKRDWFTVKTKNKAHAIVEHSKRKWKIKTWKHFPKALGNINSPGFHVKGKKYLVLVLFLESGKSYETAWYEQAAWKYLSVLMYTLLTSDHPAPGVRNMKMENVTVVGVICPVADGYELSTSVWAACHRLWRWVEGKKHHEFVICLMVR